ncbi:hypothetical protein [Acidithiobacillus ferrivorans]|uniref:Uncharacterized protein n=1 Tax=Acidithiobacillus ferrivorans TaxID=160808 RepID=A0A7T5BJ40_9PROT|nr:hypothetical protein [Acidithiobacillus ferrivorans]QQD73923.1 hypothetical protein H2515_06760 [Acidithiobacillus ferrivorans]
MAQQELAKAKDPDLRSSLQAMRRAALQARKIAIQTETSIIIVRNEQLVRLSAEVLRRDPTA